MGAAPKIKATEFDPAPVPANEGRVPSIYRNGEYLARNPLWHLEESEWKAVQITRMLQKNGISPATVCDVGCGAGEVLRQLQKTLGSDCKLYGYDVSPQAIDLAQGRANERLHFSLSDFSTVDGAWFDLLLGLDVFEHVEEGPLQNLSHPAGSFRANSIPQGRPLEAPPSTRSSSLFQQRNSSAGPARCGV
jgi:SAM-dependent methyltransferase